MKIESQSNFVKQTFVWDAINLKIQNPKLMHSNENKCTIKYTQNRETCLKNSCDRCSGWVGKLGQMNLNGRN